MSFVLCSVTITFFRAFDTKVELISSLEKENKHAVFPNMQMRLCSKTSIGKRSEGSKTKLSQVLCLVTVWDIILSSIV